MRNVFNVAVKIIGVWMFVSGLRNVGWSVRYAMESVAVDRMMGKSQNLAVCGTFLVAAGLLFLFAWLLTFKTEWVADRLKVPKDENASVPLERATLFPMGIQFVGVYLLLTAIYPFANALIHNWSVSRFSFGNSAWGHVTSGLPWMAQIVLSVLCVFKADAIAKFIANRTNVSWIKITAFVLAGLGIIAIIWHIITVASRG